jgi:serpin B
LMKDNYVAGLQQVDYGNPADAVRQINAWVAGQTADEIAELLHDGDVTPQTRLVLVNAIYFKGEWQPPFDKRDTWEQTFHLAENAGTSVPMMYQNGEFAYFADNKDTFQLLEMPYKDSALSMVVLLPRRTDGLAAFEKDLTADALAKWLQQTKIKTVRVTLPRFHLTRRVDLGAVLRALGMTSAFDPQQADFSGMTCDRKLFVSKVVHEAWLDVNEKGSEAAAATGVAMKPGAAPPREQPIDFRADHPFLFLIRDTQSGSILFLGRMSNPQT